MTAVFMDNNQLVIALVGAILLTLLLCVWALLALRQLRVALQSLELDNQALTATLASQSSEIHNQLTEDRARAVVLGKHLSALETKLTELEQQLRELKMQDPSLRLYHRAAELVKQGASMEEVMQSCDIPRAEAELLFSMHRKSG